MGTSIVGLKIHVNVDVELQDNIVIILNLRQANYWRFPGAGSRAGNNDHDRRTSCFQGVHRQHFRGKTL